MNEPKPTPCKPAIQVRSKYIKQMLAVLNQGPVLVGNIDGRRYSVWEGINIAANQIKLFRSSSQT